MQTPHGRLYQADCLVLLAGVASESVDLAFADPPFNLGKSYTSGINDARTERDYLDWCEAWLAEMIRVLKPGGTLMHWNLPKWNLLLAGFIGKHLTFRHWITVDIKYAMPVKGRLYPAHYSLLYFTKGPRPTIFHPDRIPIACCRHCGGEVKDYGGYKDKMNPNGVNLADVWTDIPPVRHAKYKNRDANALSLKLMDRIVSMTTDKGSIIIDPFGGSGTTFMAAELSGRCWIGGELECLAILERFEAMDGDAAHLAKIHAGKNTLFTVTDIKRRVQAGNPLSQKYRLTNAEKSGDGCACARRLDEAVA